MKRSRSESLNIYFFLFSFKYSIEIAVVLPILSVRHLRFYLLSRLIYPTQVIVTDDTCVRHLYHALSP